MKRALDALIRDERERQDDTLLRAQLEQTARTEEVAERRKNKDMAFVDKWRDALRKWDEMGLRSSHGLAYSPPVPNPLGPPFPRPSFPSRPLHVLIIFKGATLNASLIGRLPSRLACLMVLLTPEVWLGLANATNSYTAKQISKSEIRSDRHFAPTSPRELQQVFFARIDMILENYPTIREAYAKVSPCSPFLSPHRSRRSLVGILRGIVSSA